MGKIRLLSLDEIQKIAAGEVVERPSNAVKELIENALDAGATSLEITLQDGGKELIQIIDNGSGIAAEDLPLAIAPHATSKITSVNDLTSLNTFGFRGEALASLAAVSNLEIISRIAEQHVAYSAKSVFGVQQELAPVAHQIGTTVTVQQLFVNVPARRKFLKSAESEWVQIKQLLQAYALTYLQVHFIVRHNGAVVFNCAPTNSLIERIAQVLEVSTAQQCRAIEATRQETQLWGAISTHQVTRFNRQHIFITVNKRWIKNQQLSKAILRGYQGVLPQGKFPVVVLHLQIPAEQVDVNVHPRKEEVQLLHAAAIESWISRSITQQLEKHAFGHVQSTTSSTAQGVFASISATPPFAHAPLIEEIFSPSTSLTPGIEHTRILHKQVSTDTSAPVSWQEQSSQSITKAITQASSLASSQLQSMHVPGTTKPWQIIGVFSATYILLETQEGLWVIDQHAAHERVLFEELGKKCGIAISNRLVVPITITLTPEQMPFVERWQSLLAMYGVEVQIVSATQVAVIALPGNARFSEVQEFMQEFIERALHESQDMTHLGERIGYSLQAQMACKAAVKAGDILTLQAQEELITKLLECPNRLTCPHGRPTTWMLSDYEIAKKFKRVGN